MLIFVSGNNEDMKRLFGKDIDNNFVNIWVVLLDIYGVGLCFWIILGYLIKK